MFFALVAIVSIILYCGFQNIAAATPEQVNFNPVTIRNGAKIHVNGDKTLTATDNGNKLFADNTNGKAITDSQISSELNNFKTDQYGNDKISAVTGDARLISSILLDSNLLVPATDSDYWLDDTHRWNEIPIRMCVSSDNLRNNKMSLVGKLPSTLLFAPQTKYGVDFIDNVNLQDITLPVGTYLPFEGNDTFYLPSFFLYTQRTNIININDHKAAAYYPQKKVFNNPECIVDPSRNYYETTISSISNEAQRSDRVIGRVKFRNGVPVLEKLSVGDKVYKGDTLVAQQSLILDSDRGFRIVKDYDGYHYVFFTKADSDCYVGFKSSFEQPLKGLYVLGGNQLIRGTKAPAGEHCIRPVFDLDKSMIAYVKSSVSNSTPAISSTFSETPSSVAYAGDDKKLVIKSDEISITNNLTSNQLTSDRQDGKVVYNDNTIYVPYDSKTLTLKNGVLNTSNASYISALIEKNGVNKLVTLGTVASDFTIDLTDILDTKTVGSRIPISFYAEQINSENVSDEISASPVTVNIEVAQGSEQTIKYNLVGGSGVVPSNATVRAGKQYMFEDGSSFFKETNKFSAWEMSYTPYGSDQATTRIVNSNETIIVPDTESKYITITALYSGITAGKTTDSSSTVITVTWDTNSPDGTTAKFAVDVQGDFNSARTQMYNKINKLTTSATVPGAPTDLSAGFTQRFDGWYTDPVNGTEVTGSVTPSAKTTYYAHWSEGYKVTYCTVSDFNTSQIGYFSNGDTGDHLTEITVNTKSDGSYSEPKIGDKTAIPISYSTRPFVFAGWYTERNGAGDMIIPDGKTTKTDKDLELYAYYKESNSFLAPAKDYMVENPRVTLKEKIDISLVKSVASTVLNGGENPSPDIYNAKNDSFHLYTLLKDSNGDYLYPGDYDSWVEFRIIHVGEHDDDDTGLTFQATHMLPTAHQFNSSNASAWGDSDLFKKMQIGGEIYNIFDSSLSNEAAKDISKPESKGRIWIASLAEISGVQTQGSDESSQYKYWEDKSTPVDHTYNSNLRLGTRSGVDPDQISTDYKRSWWLRTKYATNWYVVSNNGLTNQNREPSTVLGVVPCFAM